MKTVSKIPKKVAAVGSMTGSVETISPVILKLRKLGTEVIVFSKKDVADTFRRFEIEPDKIIENPEKESKKFREDILRLNPTSILAGTNAQNEKFPVVLDHLAYAIGKEKNIFTIAVMDSWVNYAPRFSDLDYSDKTTSLKIKENGKLVHLPHLIAIMDGYAQREMIELGFPNNVLRITGNPYFDHVFQMKKNMPSDAKQRILSKDVFRKAGFNPEGKLVVFISDPIPAHPEIGYTCTSVLESFLELIDSISVRRECGEKKINVIIRPHPVRKDVEDNVTFRMSTPHIEKTVHNPNSLGPLHPDYYTIEEILIIANLVVGTVNNPLVTARALEIPTISFQPGLRIRDIQEHTNKRGITSGVCTNYSFTTLAMKALAGHLEQEPMPFVEGATERVIELLK